MEDAQITKIQELLPKSEVFPEYIREFLLSRLDTLEEQQIILLETILEEEQARLTSITL